MTKSILKELFFYREDMKAVRYVCYAMLVALSVFMLIFFNQQGAIVSATKPLSDVTDFKTLKLKTFDGDEFTSADIAEYDIVVVDMWATWCFHCVEDMPAAAQFSDMLDTAFPDNKVLYIGICTDIYDRNGDYDETIAATAQRISEKAGVHYPQLISDKEFNKEFCDLYATSLPTIYYLDSDGNIIHSTGALSPAGYTLQINNLLNAN